MTQRDLPDEMMQWLSQAQLGQMLAGAIAALIKNRSAKYRKIFTAGCKGPKIRVKVRVKVAQSLEIV